MEQLISESESKSKYPEGTPYYQKESIEEYRCDKHGKKTYYLRDSDLVVHSDETECF